MVDPEELKAEMQRAIARIEEEMQRLRWLALEQQRILGAASGQPASGHAIGREMDGMPSLEFLVKLRAEAPRQDAVPEDGATAREG
ncbi:MAG TPA: hypothetical protein VED40_16830 [Azospirillaceae bacterium]|nr:hypothetical protein [Azospirillaceae bacterium]